MILNFEENKTQESKIARIATSKTQNMTKLLKFWVNDTRKVHPDDDDEAIPWIAASKSSNQKDFKHTPFYLI